MGVSGIEALPHFGIVETKVDGHWMRIDRAGFTGDLGYELWVEPQDALWLWETLFRLGEAHKIAPIGSRALDMARIEAGFILVDVDYIGALHAIRPSQRQSPIEAGIGWAVGLKKPSYFVGKRALIREKAERRSRHILIGLEIEGRKPAPGRLPLCRQACAHGDRPHHLGPLVAQPEEEYRLCPGAAGIHRTGPPDVDRDLVSQGIEDRAQHGPLLGPQPHVLRPAAEEGVMVARCTAIPPSVATDLQSSRASRCAGGRDISRCAPAEIASPQTGGSPHDGSERSRPAPGRRWRS